MTEAETTKTTPPPSIDEYLRSRIAPRFGELLRAAEQRLATAQREVDDLHAATGTIAWEVGEGTPVIHYVNIANGEMTVAAQPATEPLMTISQSATDWARFTAGLSTVFGGDSRRPMGRSRIERVRGIKGSLRFVLTNLPDGGTWTCTLYFGAGPRPAEAQTTITLAQDVATKMQAGQLEPQMAFMQGQIKLSGDTALAMQLGMALFM
jgi:hypothetical protein